MAEIESTHLLLDFLPYGCKSGCSMHIFAISYMRNIHHYFGLSKYVVVQDVLLQGLKIICDVMSPSSPQRVVAV